MVRKKIFCTGSSRAAKAEQKSLVPARQAQRTNLERRVPIHLSLKVPKREIFDRSDFPDFYTIKSSWVGDLLVKILTYYFNF